MNWRFILTILYGLFMIWTGLLRSIEAQAFKPNAFYFCLVVGLLSVVGGFLFRAQRRWMATIVTLVASGIALTFYLSCFIGQPEKDASVRVALAIVASLGQLCVTLTAAVPAKEPSVRENTSN
ncbi:hypothetical protein [Mariniblastus fucicola]|uniref:Uncharacterized protein n=1 Tax=Mariniblastus fucicola TaxID=980251 RepID=A0A5B9P8V7_9BACT|nr:hypothetical protein [Mariniblastus fucicola]QEG21879.1 hypothetical protein MFFC18_17400 [Mariniblastus fucicola]